MNWILPTESTFIGRIFFIDEKKIFMAMKVVVYEVDSSWNIVQDRERYQTRKKNRSSQLK